MTQRSDYTWHTSLRYRLIVASAIAAFVYAAVAEPVTIVGNGPVGRMREGCLTMYMHDKAYRLVHADCVFGAGFD